MKIRYILPMVALLLGTDTCSPQLPESDPVLSTDPEAVAALRAGHADFLVILSALEAEQPIPLLPEGPYFQQLAQISTAVPAVSSLQAATILQSEEDQPECGESEHFLFSLDVEAKLRRLQRPQRQQVEVVLCYTDLEDTDAPLTAHLRGDLGEVDDALLGQLLQGSLYRILADMNAYVEDFEQRQHRILSTHMGCPDGTVYDHNNTLRLSSQIREHWCARNGLRHGPYAKGALSPLLDGVRLVEGHFDNGMRDGHWVHRDENGTVTEESWWSQGQQVPPPVTP